MKQMRQMEWVRVRHVELDEVNLGLAELSGVEGDQGWWKVPLVWVGRK